MAKPQFVPQFFSIFALVFLAIGALFAADTFLARMDREESRVEANRLFNEARGLMNKGANLKAIDKLNDAIGVERNNREFWVTLAEAQYAAGRYSDADNTLSQILRTDSTDGRANLILARVLLKEGRVSEAISYFHRAIYGHWQHDAEDNRRRARLELIELLSQQNSKEQLLAELLPMEDQTPNDLNMRLHLGELFLRAGSPPRAAQVFHGILKESPNNAAAYAGIGQAEFAEGNYRAAQRDLQAALRIDPNDTANRRWLDLCDKLLQLDPTLRGLSVKERLRRSTELVELAQADLTQCLPTVPSQEMQDLMAKADAALKASVKPLQQSDVADGNLDLAEQLWQARKKDCQSATPTDSPLALVLARVAR